MANENGGAADAPEKSYTVSYVHDGGRIVYGKATVTIIKSPYSGEYELAVRPMRLKNGHLEPLYSYEDDIRYSHCLTVIRDCEFRGKAIPEDIDRFAREISDKRKQENLLAIRYIAEKTGDSKAGTDYPMNKWREDLIYEPELRAMLDEYKKKHK